MYSRMVMLAPPNQARTQTHLPINFPKRHLHGHNVVYMLHDLVFTD